MPVCGLVSKSSRDCHTDRLVGWAPETAAEWMLLSPEAFPSRGMEMSLHDIYRAPGVFLIESFTGKDSRSTHTLFSFRSKFLLF